MPKPPVSSEADAQRLQAANGDGAGRPARPAVHIGGNSFDVTARLCRASRGGAGGVGG
jgi:hypothetical protein